MDQYSPITFDFKGLTIQFDQDGEKLVLQGKAQNPTMKVLRGKDLSKYLAGKREEEAQLQLAHTQGDTEVISTLLAQYSSVFDKPTSLLFTSPKST